MGIIFNLMHRNKKPIFHQTPTLNAQIQDRDNLYTTRHPLSLLPVSSFIQAIQIGSPSPGPGPG